VGRNRRGVVAVAVLAAVGGAGCAADLPDGVVGLTHTGCPPEESHGSGIEIEPGLVLTAAHVLKGADEITVTNGRRATTATIVAFDPTMDLALVRITDTLGVATPLAERDDIAEADVEGRTGVAFVVRDGTVRTIPVTVRRMINLRTEDIYVDGEYDRPAWELDADTQAGDSGGAVVIDGRVIGVLSLRSNRIESRAYAIDPIRGGATIREQLATGDLTAVDLTRCT
jgi:S1-C subfamily serine protease